METSTIIMDGAGGAVTYWSAETAPVAPLIQAWEDAGLDPDWAPPQPSRRKSLSRALLGLTPPAQGRRMLVRPIAGGLALVEEHEGADPTIATNVDHRVVGRAWYSEGTVSPDIDTADFAPGVEAALRDAYLRELRFISPGQLGHWLAHVATDYCRGVPLRQCGGVYFVPPTQAGLWGRIVTAVEAGTKKAAKVYCIPAVENSVAGATAIADALGADVERRVDEIIEALLADEVSARVAKHRVTMTEDLLKRLESYSGIVGAAADAMKKRVLSARAAAVNAVLAAEAAEGDASEAA